MKNTLLITILFTALGCSTSFTPTGDAGGDADDPGSDTGGEVGPDTSTEVPPGCGNGDVDEGEECDDGNDVDGDGCDSDCTWTCEYDHECDLGPCSDDWCDVDVHICMHSEVDCADDDPCTDDRCDPESGCVYEELPDWYPDGDDDGFGGSDGAPVCAESAPEGHVDNADDCCDIVPDVNPGVTGWFAEAYTCGYGTPSYDFNCDGVEERRYTAIGACSYDPTTGDCTMSDGWVSSTGTLPECGSYGSWLGGCMFDSSSGTCVPGAASSRIQTCR